MTTAECIKQAYTKAKPGDTEQFRHRFDNQLAIALQEGLDIKLTQRQIQELNTRIWYTTSLLKNTFTEGVGQWLKMVVIVTEKYVLTDLKDYKPKQRLPREQHPKNLKNNYTVPHQQEAVLNKK